MDAIKFYERYLCQDIPIYILPDKPDWFIPTDRADLLLTMLKDNKQFGHILSEYNRRFNESPVQILTKMKQFMGRIAKGNYPEYRGRVYHRKLECLKECWLHITNKCNISCNHCMFSSSPGSSEYLKYDDLLTTIYQAMDCGCKIFYLTGGEPFVYKGFTSICDEILRKKDTHIVILTNGKTISSFDLWLKAAERERIHFQISIDGLEKTHDAIRGKGAFNQLLYSLNFLKDLGFPVTLAMSVTSNNVSQMSSIVNLAHTLKIKNIHFLWLFKKGKAGDDLFVEPATIFTHLRKAYEKAESEGIYIDNIELFKSQIFSLSGTRFDLNNAAWESLAIGPDGGIYPSPALIGEDRLLAGNISEGLDTVWKESEILKGIRSASLIQNEQYNNNNLRYLVGGGDIDHSFIAGGSFVGADPYVELYNTIVLYLLAREAQDYSTNGIIGMRCRMGEYLFECRKDSAHVMFTHSNCVLSLSGDNGYSSIGSFYSQLLESQATEEVNEDIINPICYPEDEVSHIPREARIHSYGCGSPLLYCGLKNGETLVDLGSGTGVECFIAAKRVGKSGKVYGIDMLDAMLNRARKYAEIVRENLGYNNIEFCKGYLEDIPLKDSSIDVLISNCVINLSPNKRRTFSEIMRTLKPGGRICISDIVSTDDIPLEIKYNERLRGECIGGAMTENELFSLLEDLLFENIYIIKRFLYRQIKGYNFYSVTYSAHKVQEFTCKTIVYRGPFASILTGKGESIHPGRSVKVELPSHYNVDDSFFFLNENGNPTNVEQINSCDCFISKPNQQETKELASKETLYKTGCLVCGSDIYYLDEAQKRACFYCHKEYETSTLCTKEHFICDQCHAQNSVELIKTIALEAHYSDMISFLKKVRSHPLIPLHGPEHHSLVPAIILSVYKNRGGQITDQDILTGIERGGDIPGGSCAFWGSCGAAIGAGIAFSIILTATPYKRKERQLVQYISTEFFKVIAHYEAVRCCQRECWLTLKKASDLSEQYLSISLSAKEELICSQFSSNKECIGKECPLWPKF